MNQDGSNQTLLASISPVVEGFLQMAWQPVPNQAPSAANDTATVQATQTQAVVNVLANDTDEEALSGANLSITGQPSHGSAAVDASTGKITFTPSAGYTGSDALTYQICDSFLLDQKCSTAVLGITIQTSGAPALTVSRVGEAAYQNGIAKYTSASARPTFSGTASPGSVIKVEIHSDPIVLTTTADSEGNWSVTPPADLPAGDHTVTITATLNGATTEIEAFVLGITSLDELPATGANTWPLRVGGLSLLAAGLGLPRANRRRRTGS